MRDHLSLSERSWRAVFTVVPAAATRHSGERHWLLLQGSTRRPYRRLFGSSLLSSRWASSVIGLFFYAPCLQPKGEATALICLFTPLIFWWKFYFHFFRYYILLALIKNKLRVSLGPMTIRITKGSLLKFGGSKNVKILVVADSSYQCLVFGPPDMIWQWWRGSKKINHILKILSSRLRILQHCFPTADSFATDHRLAFTIKFMACQE